MRVPVFNVKHLELYKYHSNIAFQFLFKDSLLIIMASIMNRFLEGYLVKAVYRTSSGFAGIVMLAALFIEIAGFIIVGKQIGVFATLALIILSMILGLILLRAQGIALLTAMRRELGAGRVPDRELAHGALVILGAILLIIPGFVSDIIGLLLFTPLIRDLIWRYFSNRISIRTGFQTNSYKDKGQTIDLDADDYHSSDPEHSPWRKNGDTNRLE